MEKNPYYEDWLRKIEAMSEEELMNVVSNGNYDGDFLKLAKERLSYLKDGGSSNGIWYKRIEDADIKVEKHETAVTSMNHIDNGAENTLVFFANATLIIGIIATLLCFPTLCFTEKYGYSSVKEFSPTGFGVTIGVLISSLITWAALKVFANISKTLKEINARMPSA